MIKVTEIVHIISAKSLNSRMYFIQTAHLDSGQPHLASGSHSGWCRLNNISGLEKFLNVRPRDAIPCFLTLHASIVTADIQSRGTVLGNEY